MELKALVDEVKALRAEAEELASMELPAELDQVLDRAGRYLERFEEWRRGIESSRPFDAASALSPAEQEELRAAVKEYQATHLVLVERLTGLKDGLAGQMGELHRKAKALKSYVDPYPSRITIAGKRKG